MALSSTTGMTIPDLSKFPKPPASYPFPADPTIPLDMVLPDMKPNTRYGGLSAGGNGQWDWLTWRFRVMYGFNQAPTLGGIDKGIPAYNEATLATLTPFEKSFFDSDGNRPERGTVLSRATGAITQTVVRGVTGFFTGGPAGAAVGASSAAGGILTAKSPGNTGPQPPRENIVPITGGSGSVLSGLGLSGIGANSNVVLAIGLIVIAAIVLMKPVSLRD